MMDVRKSLSNKIDTNKPLVTKASDNHESETHVIGVHTTLCNHMS